MALALGLHARYRHGSVLILGTSFLSSASTLLLTLHRPSHWTLPLRKKASREDAGVESAGVGPTRRRRGPTMTSYHSPARYSSPLLREIAPSRPPPLPLPILPHTTGRQRPFTGRITNVTAFPSSYLASPLVTAPAAPPQENSVLVGDEVTLAPPHKNSGGRLSAWNSTYVVVIFYIGVCAVRVLAANGM